MEAPPGAGLESSGETGFLEQPVRNAARVPSRRTVEIWNRRMMYLVLVGT
jgi:hypothetical protein